MRCRYESLKGCADQVSEHICNAHAVKYHGLYYAYVTMTDGNNDEIATIVTYVMSQNSINIPLFWDPLTLVVDLHAIRSYAKRVTGSRSGNNYREDEADAVFSVINNWMGVTSYVDHCTDKRNWFDDHEKNCIILHDRITQELRYLTNLPTMHKQLFAYMPANFSEDLRTQRKTVLLNNFGLVIENDSPATFKIMNPTHVFKKTRDPNCVATPLVISGIRYTTEKDKQVTYKRDNSNITIAC